MRTIEELRNRLFSALEIYRRAFYFSELRAAEREITDLIAAELTSRDAEIASLRARLARYDSALNTAAREAMRAREDEDRRRIE